MPARGQGVLGRDGAVAESRRQAGQPVPLRPGGCRSAIGPQAERRAGRLPARSGVSANTQATALAEPLMMASAASWTAAPAEAP